MSFQNPDKNLPRRANGIGPGRTDGYEKVLAELDAFYDQPAVVKLAAFNAALPEARNP